MEMLSRVNAAAPIAGLLLLIACTGVSDKQESYSTGPAPWWIEGWACAPDILQPAPGTRCPDSASRDTLYIDFTVPSNIHNITACEKKGQEPMDGIRFTMVLADYLERTTPLHSCKATGNGFEHARKFGILNCCAIDSATGHCKDETQITGDEPSCKCIAYMQYPGGIKAIESLAAESYEPKIICVSE